VKRSDNPREAYGEEAAYPGFRYEWVTDRDFDVMPKGEEHACSQPKCERPAVAILHRPVWRRDRGRSTRRWYCCDDPEHFYGHRINGRYVEGRRLVRDVEAVDA